MAAMNAEEKAVWRRYDHLQRRVLRDIRELKTNPYPYLDFHVHDDIETVCLVMTRVNASPLHFSFDLEDYPLE